MNPKISKKTLTKWRKEALKEIALMKSGIRSSTNIRFYNYILLLTQELLDQHLIKEK